MELRSLTKHSREIVVAVGAAVVVLGLLLLGDILGPGQTPRTEMTRSVAEPVDRRMNAPQLIELTSRWCAACRRMAPVMSAVERDCSRRGIAVHRLDINSDVGRRAARRLRVQATPTYIFIDHRGAELKRLVGRQPLEVLEQGLAELSARQEPGGAETTTDRASAPLLD